MENFTNYLKNKQAAEYLGVSEGTLRNWEKKGLITAFRHPVNNYRLYRKEDLDEVLQKVQKRK
jgi:MerR family transcriptional regulator, copper efflux regulator